LPLRQWAWLVKLFELEVTARQAAVQTGLSYPTVLRAFTLLRRAILAQEDDPALQPLVTSEVELDESYFGPRRSKRTRGGKRGRGAPFKIPVFGILERKGRVTVSVVPNVTRQTLLGATLKLVKRGSLIYTDRYKGYDALTFCGYRHLRVDHGRRFSHGRVHINGLEGFWSYAKGKLIRHRGVSPHRFPLYLYEMQFRYNHRTEDLFGLLLNALLQPVPTAL
jgi:transposase